MDTLLFAFRKLGLVAGVAFCAALATAIGGSAMAATPATASPALQWEALVADEGVWLLKPADDSPKDRHVLVEAHDVRTIAGARVARLRWRVATTEGFVDAPVKGSKVPHRIAVSKRGVFILDRTADDATVTRALLKRPTIAVPKRPKKPLRTADGAHIRVSPEVCIGYDTAPAGCGDVCLTEVCMTPGAGFTAASGKVDGRDQKLVAVPHKFRIHRRADAGARYAVPLGDSPFWGPKDARVHIVVACQFGPFCLRLRDTLRTLRKEYPATVKVVWKHFVVHPPSRKLNLALCAAARLGRFAEMEDALWERAYGKDLRSEEMDRLATDLGLDAKAFASDVATVCHGVLAADHDMLTGVGVTATPTTFINGRPVTGAAKIETLRAVVDEELRAVNAAMMAGTPLTRYHESILETALKGTDWRPDPSLFEKK